MAKVARSGSRQGARQNRTAVAFTVTVLILLVLSIVGLLGGLGNAIKSFLLGIFGLSAIAVVGLTLIVAILRAAGFTKKRISVRRNLGYAIGLFVIFLLFLQVLTTVSLYTSLTNSSYSNYLLQCFQQGADTSGGLLAGVFAYPLLLIMGKYSMVVLAILFFLVLLAMIFPTFMIAESKAQSYVKKTDGEKPSRTVKNNVKVDVEMNKEAEPLKLFVDTVRGGDKNSQRIRKRSIFDGRAGKTDFEIFNPNKEQFFDLEEEMSGAEDGLTPYKAQSYGVGKDMRKKPKSENNIFDEISRKGGNSQSESLPFAQDSRPDSKTNFGLKSSAGGKQRIILPLEEDEWDDSDYIAPKPANKSSSIDYQDIGGDLPLFLTKHNEAKQRANEKLYGDKGVKRLLPDVGDVESKDEKQDKKTAKSFPFANDITGEQYTAKATNQPVIDKGSKATARSNINVDDVFIRSAEELRRYQEKQGKYLERTITPSDASSMEHYESLPNKAVIPDEEDKRVTPADNFSVPPKPSSSRLNDANRHSDSILRDLPTFAKERKPRSDIGGSHYTAEDYSKQAPTISKKEEYISPQKATQLNFEQAPAPMRPYVAPPVHLLMDYPPPKEEEDVSESGKNLVQALSNFGIETEVLSHQTGPTFTQFALSLPDGVSVNKVTPLEKDIKRKLMINKSIRIIPSIPGMDAFGVEIPNKKTSTVGLRQLITSPVFDKENKLFFAIGVDVSGQPIYGDLLKMPHLLVAGSTGSGKSVCLNVLICSIMYHYSPDVVRFIMIDPKKVELSIYRNMPHMVLPNTVTECSKAVNALNWAVAEMDRRYDVFQENNCRNISEYNAMQKSRGNKTMYYIVLIIDEMADLMSRAKREVEDRIQCLTSKARASGIHLVVATQRPSVDVITGTIKNNIPTRIAFMVTSFNDSRTILDKGGAESLFGSGDMLYSNPTLGEPVRLQGPFLEREVVDIVEFIKAHNDCSFDGEAESIIQADKTEPNAVAAVVNSEAGEDDDIMLAKALYYVIESGQASISKLQRKFKLGYSRAARIVDTMEERRYIGGADGSNKPRSVLITMEEYKDLYGDGEINNDTNEAEDKE